MKHNFNNPNVQTIPHIDGLPCDCLDCCKNAAYTKQLNDRNAVYVNAFDFPSFDRLGATARTMVDHADPDSRIGNYVKSRKDQPVYNNPGEAPYSTIKAGSSLGKFKNLNQKGNWMQVTGDVHDKWVSFVTPADFTFTTPNLSLAKPLTVSDKIGIASDVIKTTIPGAAPLVEGTQAIGEGVANTINALVGPLKWVLILVVVVVLVAVFMRIKG